MACKVSAATGVYINRRVGPLRWRCWRRGWDSNHCWLLKTKNLTDSLFLTIRQISTNDLSETRIEHAEMGAAASHRAPSHAGSIGSGITH